MASLWTKHIALAIGKLFSRGFDSVPFEADVILGYHSLTLNKGDKIVATGIMSSLLNAKINARKEDNIILTGFSCCAFLYFNRGTSKSKEEMAFRRWFYKLTELRSLVPDKIPFMAVTATATRQTKDIITSVLRFANFEEVSESPNKANICYSVQTMDKRTPLLQYFQWILNELKEKKGGTERTIIYCQTIKQCSTL